MKTYPQIFERFVTAVLPTDLPASTVLRLQAAGRATCVARGSVARIDDGADMFVFVAEGATKLVAQASEGREQIVAFHFADDLVSIPAHSAHAYSLWGLVDCELLLLRTRDLRPIAGDSARLLDTLLDRTMTALHRCRDKAVGLGRKNALERVAGFLDAMADRIGRTTGTGCTIDLPMSRRDIADSLGLTIETVSRQLGELRASGLIETSGRSTVRLLDPSELSARAGHRSARPR